MRRRASRVPSHTRRQRCRNIKALGLPKISGQSNMFVVRQKQTPEWRQRACAFHHRVLFEFNHESLPGLIPPGGRRPPLPYPAACGYRSPMPITLDNN